jgi:hypothetical protein
MKYLFAVVLAFALLMSCTEKVGNCKKDKKRVMKERKSGQFKNW